MGGNGFGNVNTNTGMNGNTGGKFGDKNFQRKTNPNMIRDALKKDFNNAENRRRVANFEAP